MKKEMIRKSISLTLRHEKWLKEKTTKLGISESDILRRLLDKEIDQEHDK